MLNAFILTHVKKGQSTKFIVQVHISGVVASERHSLPGREVKYGVIILVTVIEVNVIS